jgi:hypothetical protein
VVNRGKIYIKKKNEIKIDQSGKLRKKTGMKKGKEIRTSKKIYY